MGTINTIDQNILDKEKLKILSSKYMCCTNCFSIPLIKPFLMGGKFYISIYCKCLNDERKYMLFDDYTQLITKSIDNQNFCSRHKSLKGFLFCITCEKWLCGSCYFSHKQEYQNHIYNVIPVRLKEYCDIHPKENAVGYCNSCGTNACKKCYDCKIKIRHDVFLYRNNKDIKKMNKKWNYNNFTEIHLEYFTKIEKIKDDIINLINNSKDISDEEKNLWNNKINDIYMKNKNINNQLSEYIVYLFSNYDNSFNVGNIVNYNIFRNLSNIKYDNTNFSISEELSPIKNAEKAIRYFNQVHIIHLSTYINIKNITSEKQNVTNQIAKLCLLDENNIATLTSNGIIIIWNYLKYEELYRIKKISVYENINFQNDNFNNNINNDNNNDNNNNDNNNQIKIINIIKTYNSKKKISENETNKENNNNINSNNNNDNNNISNNIINNNIVNEEDELEEDLLPNFNFISMAYIKKYKLLAIIANHFKQVYIFDITKKEVLPKKLISHKKEVLDVLALKNNNLASYGNDNAIRIWDMKYFQNILTINAEIKKYYIYFTQLLYGNLIFATGESVIKIFKLQESEFDKDITCIPKPINYFELPDKKLMISSEDFQVRILKPPYYEEVIKFFKRTKIYSFLLLDKKKLLLSLDDNSLHVLILNKKKHKNNMNSIATFWSPIGSLVKTNDNRLISISWDNYIKIILVGD